jgi:hypothetical protein
MLSENNPCSVTLAGAKLAALKNKPRVQNEAKYFLEIMARVQPKRERASTAK